MSFHENTEVNRKGKGFYIKNTRFQGQSDRKVGWALASQKVNQVWSLVSHRFHNSCQEWYQITEPEVSNEQIWMWPLFSIKNNRFLGIRVKVQWLRHVLYMQLILFDCLYNTSRPQLGQSRVTFITQVESLGLIFLIVIDFFSLTLSRYTNSEYSIGR